ncbi:DDE-type integrase/transposase/recombinase [Clostridium aestuarii]|uniref:DDE-type integrase/transposase/recombinase n=1 Tax=Clostridium aestuarii TaxID=338193 RepID=UPI003AEFCA66
MKDLYNNEIVAYKVSKSLELTFVLDTINQAINSKGKSLEGLIIHSDQGFHYTSKEYQHILAKN